MDHVAIMSRWLDHRGSSKKSGKKDWKLIEKILTGEKTIESRWYKTRRAPWDKVVAGQTVYFKNSGEKITVKAEIKKVLQFSDLDSKKVEELLNKFGNQIGVEKESAAKFSRKFGGARYGILIFLKNPMKIIPFSISKKGFGNMASWLSVNNISTIKQ